MNKLNNIFEKKYKPEHKAIKLLGKEMEFFRQYDKKLFSKLEKKILDLENANKELSISEEKYRLFFENVSDIIFTLDKDLNITSISPGLERILGYKTEDFIGRPVSDLKNILTRKSFEQALYNINVILNGERIDFFIYEFIARNGERKYGEISASPIIHDGTITGVICVARDITDRKRVEDVLSKNEEKFRKAFYVSPDAVNINRLEDGMYVSINPGFTRIMGYTEEDIIGKSSVEYNIWDNIEDRKKVVDSLRKNGEVINFEAAFRRKDGNVRYGLMSAFVINLDGVPHIFSITRDITKRKQAEKELLQSEHRFRELFENMSSCVAVYEAVNDGEDFIFKDFNKAAEKVENIDRKDLIGKSVSQIFPSILDFGLLDVFKKVWKSGQPEHYPLAFYKDDRIEGWRENYIYRLPTGEIVAIYNDITERKRAEEALKENENKYRLLADNVNDVIFVLDMNLHYTYISPSVKMLRGYEPKEVLRQPAADILTPASWELALSTLNEVMEIEKTQYSETSLSRTLELEMKRKDGSTLWTEVKLSFIRDENHKPVGILGLTRDISDRKQTEQRLQETLDNLRKAIGTTIQVMVSAIEVRDPYTAGHQLRVADLARCIGREMGLSRHQVEGIRLAGSIHDIGKLSVPAEILVKPTKLTDMEFALIKEHARKGYEILKDVETDWLLAEIVYQHHERIDGSGYPNNLKGEEILLEARIMAVADVVESMASHRPYRPALGVNAALDEIIKNRDILYDPEVVDACLRLFNDKGYKLVDTQF